jgi:hypothetical protein
MKRLETTRSLLHMILPLPANIILVGWETPEVINNQPTGRIIPDIGGKLDNLIPGKVDASLRCFAKYDPQGTRYFVQTQPDGIREWIGIRGAYHLPKEIDVTIGPRAFLPKPGQAPQTPWEKVFGLPPNPQPQAQAPK